MHILSFVLFLWGSSHAFGADTSYRSKLGIDLRGFKTNLQNEVGWLAGVRTAHFIGSSNAYIGGAGYYGAPEGGDPKINNCWYAGLTLGYDGRIDKSGVFEFALLAGLGSGKSSTFEQTSYYVVEPSVSAGFLLGGGFRLTAGVSYVHMTKASLFSGPTFGFRIEYKSQTTIKEVND